MPPVDRTNKKTPHRVNECRRLHAEGKPIREIARTVGIGRETVKRYLAGLHEPSEPTRPSKTGKTGKAPKTPKPSKAAAPGSEPEPGDDILALLRERLSDATELVRKVTPGVAAGTYQVSHYTQLVKLERELGAELAQLTPPAPPDPEKDPVNLESTIRTAKMLERLIEDAEARAVCLHCGRLPFRVGQS